MTEKLLHFIWQFQYFNKQQLFTESGEPLQVLKQGYCNTNQGPDFLEASVKIGNITLVGNIELHIHASDWYRHQHAKDTNYANIILHVVWHNDRPVMDTNERALPTLALQSRVAKLMLQRYEQLMGSSSVILCKNFQPALSEIAWLSWKERLVAERLEAKSKYVLQLYRESNHHWEETFWWLLAGNFGMKVNTPFFETMAKTISINILAKHKSQIHQLEAILLGQANLLAGEFEESYPQLLQREYRLYQQKYKLVALNAKPAFLRMRPAAFPTVRLAQLAMLVKESSHLFSKIKSMQQLHEVKQLLNVTANDYWHYHYRFDELTDCKPKNIGSQMVGNILINTIVPVLFAYGLYNKEEQYKEKAIHWLTGLAAEQNTITGIWKDVGIENKNAFDSQSLIQLTNNYCRQKKCLECAVGNKLLKTG